MLILPAIDLYQGQAVRLVKGDYSQMTVYSSEPARVAEDFVRCGAAALHLVDLEGARDGGTPNLEVIRALCAATPLTVEVGGGIRSMEVISRYIEEAGVSRVILGTVVVTEPELVDRAVARYGAKIAVGVDSRAGRVAIRGWREEAALDTLSLCRRLEQQGVQTVIATDIARDGLLAGSNHELYRQLLASCSLQLIASGGVSSLEDVRQLKALGLHGAIVGKAYYTGALDLRAAIREAS